MNSEIDFNPLPLLTPDEEAELTALQHLSDDALWAIVREKLPVQKQKQLQKLMTQHVQGILAPDDFVLLAQLAEQGEQLTLRKSEAMALLSRRGYKVSFSKAP